MEGVAMLATGIFSGIALDVSVAEAPARSKIPAQESLKVFQQSFPRQAALQVVLSATAAVTAGIVAYKAPSESRERILYGLVSGTMFSMLPYTQIALMPTNWKLLSEAKKTDKEITSLTNTWAQRHAVRTVAGLACCGLLLLGMKK